MRYDYSVVRFVPDSFKAEFVNVGLVVGSPETGEWKVRRVRNSDRASRFRNGAPLSAVWDYLDTLDGLVGDLADGEPATDGALSSGWLAEEQRRLRNLVQLSPPRPYVADSVDEAMGELWERMVVDPDLRSQAGPQSSRSALMRAYRTAHVDAALIHRNCVAEVGRQRDRLDFVIGNAQVAQIAHAWSFRGQDLSRTVHRIKAWSWTMRDVRERADGRVVYGHGDGDPHVVDGSVPIDVVYDQPDTDDGRRALDEVREVLEGIDVTPRVADDADLVAADAVERLRHLA